MPAEILVYGVIGETFFGDGVTAKSVAEQLAVIDSAEDIRVRINSPGGLAHEGIAIHNLLAERRDRVTVDIDALAASAATVVAMAGARVRMASNAQFMIHKPFTLVYSHAEDMRKMADVLDQVEGLLIQTYQTRSDLPEEQIAQLLAAETYLTAQQAKEMGFVDEITGPGSDPEPVKAQVSRLANLVKRPESQHQQQVRTHVNDLLRRQRELVLTKLRVLG